MFEEWDVAKLGTVWQFWAHSSLLPRQRSSVSGIRVLNPLGQNHLPSDLQQSGNLYDYTHCWVFKMTPIKLRWIHPIMPVFITLVRKDEIKRTTFNKNVLCLQFNTLSTGPGDCPYCELHKGWPCSSPLAWQGWAHTSKLLAFFLTAAL